MTPERLTELTQYNRLGRAGGFFALILPPTVDEMAEVFELAAAAREPAGAGLCTATQQTETWGLMRCGLFAGHPGGPPDAHPPGHHWYEEGVIREPASPAEPGLGHGERLAQALVWAGEQFDWAGRSYQDAAYVIAARYRALSDPQP